MQQPQIAKDFLKQKELAAVINVTPECIRSCQSRRDRITLVRRGAELPLFSRKSVPSLATTLPLSPVGLFYNSPLNKTSHGLTIQSGPLQFHCAL